MPALTPLVGPGASAYAETDAAATSAKPPTHDHGSAGADTPSVDPVSPSAGEDHGSAHQHGQSRPKQRDKAAVTYTCPMHPEVTSTKPGRCPKCGMNLVPKKDNPPAGDGK